MLLLTTTSDKIRVVTTTAQNIQGYVSYLDYNTSTTTLTPGKNVVSITTATTTDISGSPSANINRQLKSI